MSWWDASKLPASAEILKHSTDTSGLSASDGLHPVKVHLNKKLLPLPKAINREQTRLFERNVTSFVQAYTLSFVKSDPGYLEDWLDRYRITEVDVEKTIPAGSSEKGRPLHSRSVHKVDTEKMKALAEQFIKHLLSPLTIKETGGNKAGSTKIPTVAAGKRKRKSGKKKLPGDSNYISDHKNTVPDFIGQKEIEEGLDSTRNRPDSHQPRGDSS